ncbi:hypothetical protein MGG_05632 [Pyricularia oryzae 70-15]|uniref:Uncharacterized protein n=3 Tax=Pyricularia oryzae TaxID=318829 RepID=G4MNK2_PYRO7|nr:uncharacterized protein MGG_05632 [Pyricularia oryzae 70-15]EHA57908.1 hypothetical protein MGG_05632 [Pyricularia oryzae 70-15]ELQ36959.1 hypothetical protein OOU_Y34scaffold00624g55 [Pyricularia oryzae Y34]KAI7923770.1 hypothetical protein M9X92_004219 [Pyricularia oryzae]KAI7931252.1 hypothetical protein M0657_001206 [Pyricularia oryzae]
MHITTTAILSTLFLANFGLAVDCQNRSYTTCGDNKTVQYYDLDTGELCPMLDCGGGRAPPKTNEPCCPAYKGTEACVTTKGTLACFKDKMKSTSTDASHTSTSAATKTTEDSRSSTAKTGSESGPSAATRTGTSTKTDSAKADQITAAPTRSDASSGSAAAATTTPVKGAAAGQLAQAVKAVVGVAAVGAVLVV